MKKLNKDKRTYLIIGLCAILVVMAVGYAAFAQQLTINGTAETTSSWCVGFDPTKTSDYVATPGLQGGDTPTATMSYSGGTCGSGNYTTNASMTANFAQPGDQVVYTFTIKNDSTLNAKLDSINENVTTANSAIEYTLSGADDDDVLGPGDTTTLVVTVKYKESVTEQPSTTSWGLEIKLNFSQTSEEASAPTPAPTASGYYVFDTTGHYIRGSYTPTSAEGVWPAGRTVALKYVLDGSGNIAEVYACTKFEGLTNPVCLRGGTENYENPSNFFSANQATIAGVMALPEYSTFEASGSCSSTDSYSNCNVNNLSVDATSDGGAQARDNSSGNVGCDVYAMGTANCFE